MKRVLFLLVYFPLICFAQSRTDWYDENTIYLEKAEIKGRIGAVSTSIDNRYALVDSVLIVFKTTPYPDELKKYEIKLFLEIVFYNKDDTVFTSSVESRNDSTVIAEAFPSNYKTLNVLVKVHTLYKRKRGKVYKRASENVFFATIDQKVDRNIRILPTRRTGCYMRTSSDMFNEIIRHHYYNSIDELIIRTVPRAN